MQVGGGREGCVELELERIDWRTPSQAQNWRGLLVAALSCNHIQYKTALQSDGTGVVGMTMV